MRTWNGSRILLAPILLVGLLAGVSGTAEPAASRLPAAGSPPGLGQEAASLPLDTPVATNPEDQLGGPTSGATYVPVLMYHWIRVNPDPRDRIGFTLSVTPTDFAKQMLYLKSHGYQVVSLQLAVEGIREHRALPSHAVVLTFDDGYRDFYTTASPILQSLGFTATDFVITSYVGRLRYLTWPMIQTLDQEGFTIGDHTVNHAALSSLPPAQALWEMSDAKQQLEAYLNHPVLDMAYPSGEFNQSVMRQAQLLGFECAVSTRPGPYHTPDTLFELSRQRVSGGISMGHFAQLVGGPAPTAEWLRWVRGQLSAMLVHTWRPRIWIPS
jgi:peptidoglycan/xylan/chitin deacetylase (PgdA/CDA1 family)